MRSELLPHYEPHHPLTHPARRIKKAYRKKALELHPDRNYGDVDNATKLFAEVQTAYEVLSDPHERAWYDSHQDVLVHGAKDSSYGGAGTSVGGLSVADLIQVIIDLPSTADYTDSTSGFYTTMRELFDQIAEEEYLAADDQGVTAPDYPSFGHADDDYEGAVKPFYAVWMGFSTRKTFAWRDVYKLSEASDRRVRRTMEKENKRHRDEGIREYNDVVRALLSRVRKRDRRYLPNRQTEEERQKALRDAAAAQAARSRAANRVKLEQQKQPDWVTGKGESSTTTESETSGADEEDEAFECVACGKTFKSERQFEAHEESRKHRKRVQHLRRKMLEEERKLNAQGGDDTAEDGGDQGEVRTSNVSNEVDSASEEQPLDHNSVTEISGSLHSVEDNEDTREEESSAQGEKLSQSPQSDDTIILQQPFCSIDATLRPSSTLSGSGEDDTEDDEYAPRHEVEGRVFRENGTTSPEQRSQFEDNDEMDGLVDDTGDMTLEEKKDEDQIPAPQQSTTEEGGGKAKQKRAKKAAQQQASAASDVS